MSNPTFSRIKDEILRIPATQALVHTDGQGRLIEVFAPTRDDAGALTEGLDLAVSAVAVLGRQSGFGRLHTALFSFASGHVVLGALPSNETIAVVAGRDANIGLLLSQLRRAIAGEVGA